MFRCLKTVGAIALLAAGSVAQEPVPQDPTDHADDMAVVVNLKNSTTRLSLGDLRKIFAGEKRTWPGGIPVKLIVRAAGTHEHDAVLHLLKFTEPEFSQYWIVQDSRGGDAQPVAVFSNGMQKEAVMSIPGAIALIAAEDVRPGMKVLKIDNRLPRQEGYPLR
jgi:ABC-type phosphate transport system substrate-binding protein